MRTIVNLIAAVALTATVTMAQALQPIANVIDAPIVTTSGKTLTSEQIKQSISLAGAALGWKVVEEKPGLLIATILLRKHQAIIEIPYTSTKYSITYKSSINLDEAGGQIHRNYNGWILNLTKAINNQLSSS